MKRQGEKGGEKKRKKNTRTTKCLLTISQRLRQRQPKQLDNCHLAVQGILSKEQKEKGEKREKKPQFDQTCPRRRFAEGEVEAPNSMRYKEGEREGKGKTATSTTSPTLVNRRMRPLTSFPPTMLEEEKKGEGAHEPCATRRDGPGEEDHQPQSISVGNRIRSAPLRLSQGWGIRKKKRRFSRARPGRTEKRKLSVF